MSTLENKSFELDILNSLYSTNLSPFFNEITKSFVVKENLNNKYDWAFLEIFCKCLISDNFKLQSGFINYKCGKLSQKYALEFVLSPNCK